MRFDLNDDQQMLREATRRFAADRIAPGSREREAAHAISPETIRELGEQGLLGVNIPADLGGSEAGAVAYAVAVQEIAAADASVAVTMAVSNMVAEVITNFGTDEQKQTHVPKIVSGEYFGGAFALSEPGAGSDAAAMRTKATKKGDQWVISGEKLWITTGDNAGVIVLWARTNEQPGPKGISCFLVPGDTPGITAGKPEEKMGLRASHTVGLTFDACEIPDSALLGAEGGGFRIAMAALDGGRIGIGSQATGMARAALDEARRYALERHQFNKPIAEQQAIQFMLADMATQLDAAWLLTLRAAWLKEQGKRFSKEAAMAKVLASESANKIVRDAVQIHGGYGYTEEYAVAKLYRDCRVTQIYEGTSEIQRVVIAREVLRELSV